LIVCALLTTAYGIGLQFKVGKEAMMKEQLSWKIMENVPEEAKKQMIEDSKKPFGATEMIGSAVGFVGFFVFFALLSLIYGGLL
jgi:hypothetical protein